MSLSGVALTLFYSAKPEPVLGAGIEASAWRWRVLCCVVMLCLVLCCVVMLCLVLCCVVMLCPVLCCGVLCCDVLSCTVLFCVVLQLCSAVRCLLLCIKFCVVLQFAVKFTCLGRGRVRTRWNNYKSGTHLPIKGISDLHYWVDISFKWSWLRMKYVAWIVFSADNSFLYRVARTVIR